MIPGVVAKPRRAAWRTAVCEWCRKVFPWKYDRPECCGYPCARRLAAFRRRLKRLEEMGG